MIDCVAGDAASPGVPASAVPALSVLPSEFSSAVTDDVTDRSSRSEVSTTGGTGRRIPPPNAVADGSNPGNLMPRSLIELMCWLVWLPRASVCPIVTWSPHVPGDGARHPDEGWIGL